MFLGSLVLLGSLGVLRVGFRSVVSRPLGVVGALCGCPGLGVLRMKCQAQGARCLMSGLGRTVLK